MVLEVRGTVKRMRDKTVESKKTNKTYDILEVVLSVIDHNKDGEMFENLVALQYFGKTTNEYVHIKIGMTVDAFFSIKTYHNEDKDVYYSNINGFGLREYVKENDANAKEDYKNPSPSGGSEPQEPSAKQDPLGSGEQSKDTTQDDDLPF